MNLRALFRIQWAPLIKTAILCLGCAVGGQFSGAEGVARIVFTGMVVGFSYIPLYFLFKFTRFFQRKYQYSFFAIEYLLVNELVGILVDSNSSILHVSGPFAQYKLIDNAAIIICLALYYVIDRSFNRDNIPNSKN